MKKIESYNTKKWGGHLIFRPPHFEKWGGLVPRLPPPSDAPEAYDKKVFS